MVERVLGSDVTAGFELDQGARLFRARSDDAARAMILEAACDEPDAVRKQGGGQCVAAVAAVAPAC